MQGSTVHTEALSLSGGILIKLAPLEDGPAPLTAAADLTVQLNHTVHIETNIAQTSNHVLWVI